jgi:Voltage gated chloride channel
MYGAESPPRPSIPLSGALANVKSQSQHHLSVDSIFHQQTARWLQSHRDFVSEGASAGFTMAFITPIAGTLFPAEEGGLAFAPSRLFMALMSRWVVKCVLFIGPAARFVFALGELAASSRCCHGLRCRRGLGQIQLAMH